jgi:hypothetical protein
MKMRQVINEIVKCYYLNLVNTKQIFLQKEKAKFPSVNMLALGTINFYFIQFNSEFEIFSLSLFLPWSHF